MLNFYQNKNGIFQKKDKNMENIGLLINEERALNGFFSLVLVWNKEDK